MAKLTVLFLCTGNSCRSQMAEGFTRALKGYAIEPFSAGVEPRGLDPRAVTVMAEAGVAVGGQRSKHVDELRFVMFDHVVSVCAHAREACPPFLVPVRTLHVAFDDPPRLARSAKSADQALAHYRRVRDEIKAFVLTLPNSLDRKE